MFQLTGADCDGVMVAAADKIPSRAVGRLSILCCGPAAQAAEQGFLSSRLNILIPFAPSHQAFLNSFHHQPRFRRSLLSQATVINDRISKTGSSTGPCPPSPPAASKDGGPLDRQGPVGRGSPSCITTLPTHSSVSQHLSLACFCLVFPFAATSAPAQNLFPSMISSILA